jgi:hypothetical protein
MVEIRTSKTAQEKYNEIMNGSKEEIDEFLKKAKGEGINWSDQNKVYQGKDFELYKRKCKNIYLIFSRGKKGEVFILDFLTESELPSWMK